MQASLACLLHGEGETKEVLCECWLNCISGELERGVEPGARLGLARPRQRVEGFSNCLLNSFCGPGAIPGAGCCKIMSYIKLTM